MKQARTCSTGQERDEETGLYYYGARYYAPWLCRFTSADPMGMVDGPSLYAYVRNNPIKLNDPDGMVADGEDGLLLESTGKITEDGNEVLSEYYNKQVIKAVEQFSEEVTKYLENNEGVSLKDAIEMVLDLNEDSEWMYVQYRTNNNATGREYKAEHAGLIYKALNVKPEVPVFNKTQANVKTIDDHFVNNNELLSYKIPPTSGIPNEFVINNLDSIAPLNVSIRLGRDMIVMDSSIAAKDSLAIDLTSSFQGDNMILDVEFVTNADSTRAGKPSYSLITKDKPKNSKFRAPKGAFFERRESLEILKTAF